MSHSSQRTIFTFLFMGVFLVFPDSTDKSHVVFAETIKTNSSVVKLSSLPQNESVFPVILGESDQDSDGDGLSDYEERTVYQTYWYDSDTDDDGFSDYDEVMAGFSPKQKIQTMKEADTDNDGLSDDWEIKLGTNLMIRDTDGDGHLDGTEVYHGFDPLSADERIVEKKIEVSDKDLKLKFYFGDKLLLDVPVSTGKPSTPTPHGDFEILAKVPVKHYAGPGYDYPNTLYNLHFTTKYYRYYIHGAYWHNNFGIRPVSGGCVNVRYEDMKDLYNFTTIGTKVIVN